MVDRILSTLSLMIFIMSGALLCSSGLGLVMDLGFAPIQQLKQYTGIALLFLSLLLAVSNLVLTEHPLFEYWLTVLMGSLIGICYLS